MLQPLRSALALVAATGVIACNASAQDKIILAHYMPWYETPDVRGFWGFHWTGFNDEADPTQFVGPDNRRDIWSNYYPLIEPYDSADPDLLECHLLQMKLAGIDGVLADWYGLSDAADYAIIHFATEALFDATAEFGLQFGAVFEDRTYEFRVNNGLLNPGDVNADLAATMQWVQTNWFSSPHYAHKDGRPLLLNFGPIYLTTPTPWAVGFAALNPLPNFFALSNLWTLASAEGAFTWVRPSIFEDFPSSAVAQQRVADFFNVPGTTPANVIPSVNPGFDDVYAVPFPDIPYRNGDTFTDMLTVAMDGPWSHIQLVTWNDFGEGTMIEPTREFGYLFLEKLQDARRAENPAFPYSAGDLRLPARLYTLRKDQNADQALLDEVLDRLKSGDTIAARVLLDLAEGVDLFTGDAADAVVASGETITLTAPNLPDATGLYQWTRDGLALTDSARVSGATARTITITPATLGDVGFYRLTVAAGSTEARSEPTLVAVRGSAFDVLDVNDDGVLTTADVQDFLGVHSVLAR